MTSETIVVHARMCTGCRACELACGFRRTKGMDPAQSSIQIRRSPSTGEAEVEIQENCDVCRGLETPLCIQVCSPRALGLGRKLMKPEAD